jgi:hypothetical protein
MTFGGSANQHEKNINQRLFFHEVQMAMLAQLYKMVQ